MLDADYFTPADAQSIPTGEIRSVEGTPMDFRKEKALGEEIDSDYEPLRFGGGYDHNWVLKNEGRFAKVAEVTSDKSGIRWKCTRIFRVCRCTRRISLTMNREKTARPMKREVRCVSRHSISRMRYITIISRHRSAEKEKNMTPVLHTVF